MIKVVKNSIVGKMITEVKGADYNILNNKLSQNLIHISSLDKLKAGASLELLKEAGIFRPEENDLTFLGKDTIYFIQFNVNETYVKAPIFQYDYKKDEVHVEGIRLSLDEYIEKVKARSASYDFIPKNGWSFMYYLDFIVQQKEPWSEAIIKSIDDLVSKGFNLNPILPLLAIRVAPEHLESSLGIPLKWVEKIHNYRRGPYTMTMVDEYTAFSKNIYDPLGANLQALNLLSYWGCENVPKPDLLRKGGKNVFTKFK